MNGRERLLAALSGEQPDRIPFAINLWQWFYANKGLGKLPTELSHAQHPLDVLRYLEADIFDRWDPFFCTQEVFPAELYVEEYVANIRDPEQARQVAAGMMTSYNYYPPGLDTRLRRWNTPYGTLTQTWEYSPDALTDFENEYLWKDFETEYDAVRCIVEARDFRFDGERWAEWVARIGDDGLPMLKINETPLKALHWLAGPANATLWIMEHPDEMLALATVHAEKTLRLLESVVDRDDVLVFMLLDNMDSMFYAPYLFDKYCRDFLAQAADLIHSRGKYLAVHACGRSKALLSRVGQVRIDMLEGISQPPLGDVRLGEVRAQVGYERFTVNGGMSLHQQEIEDDAEAKIHAFTRELFASMADGRHFIYGSSCNTSPLTPWENILYLRDAAHAYGRLR